MGSQCSIGTLRSSMGFIHYILCIADDMVAEIEVIMVPFTSDDGRQLEYGILFTNEHHEGMVGEDHESYQAYQVSFLGSSPEVKPKPIHYRALKGIYNKLEGKERRLRFWSWLIHMTDEAVMERIQRSTDDAISKVI